MNDKLEIIKEAAPKHATYWKDLSLIDYRGGPFLDRTGGCIIFSSPTIENAQEIIKNDPFMKEECLEKYWVKEWFIDN